MKYSRSIAGFVAVICILTYVTQHSSSMSEIVGLAITGDYGSAARQTVNTAFTAEQRRKWVLTLHQTDFETGSKTLFSIEGEDAETLVLTSGPMDNLRCKTFASSEDGCEAVRHGFTKVVCRGNSVGAVYEVSLTPGS